MYQRKLEKDIRCPLDKGLSIFAGKWKSRIICVLAKNDRPLRYKELQKEMVNITDAVLSNSLKELTKDGIIERIQYEEIPPRVEYQLTKKGQSVLPILISIANWVEDNTEKEDIIETNLGSNATCSLCSSKLSK